jgi:hypothetical protein
VATVYGMRVMVDGGHMEFGDDDLRQDQAT